LGGASLREMWEVKEMAGSNVASFGLANLIGGFIKAGASG